MTGDARSPFDRPFDRLRDRREIPGQAGNDGKAGDGDDETIGVKAHSHTWFPSSVLYTPLMPLPKAHSSVSVPYSVL